MTSKYWGQPILTVRMPQAVIDGLKDLADRQQSSVSQILRELAEAELDREGIPHRNTKPLEGQQRIDGA